MLSIAIRDSSALCCKVRRRCKIEETWSGGYPSSNWRKYQVPNGNDRTRTLVPEDINSRSSMNTGIVGEQQPISHLRVLS